MNIRFASKIGFFTLACCVFMSFCPADDVISKEKGTTIINTTSLTEDVEGYAGPTPLKIYIKKDKIEKIEALENIETPKYFAIIKRDLLVKWNGLTVKKAAEQKVDCITGATYSSESVIENVRRGLDYYNKKGKK
ncbi:MAG: FMN-binding protein [Bacteroidaceae bacterium]|nr:FMN-binding protein [Bacteroidaceae bacterium]